MLLSREARVVAGVTLIVVPTIAYGGITLLGLLTGGVAGVAPGGLDLTETQFALFRAGHAHAGVWVILSLVVQVLLDAAVLSNPIKWAARISAPVGAAVVSGGFFGLAFVPGFRWIIYLGALCLITAVLATGVGLLRRPPPAGIR